jgi:Ca-activated chloride channel family protein
MYELAQPQLLWLILLPPILRFLLPPYREPRQAVRATWFARLADLLKITPGEGAVVAKTSWLRIVFQWLMWSLVVLALARPQFLEDPVQKIIPTRDLLLLVDLSGSMEARDFTNHEGETVDRLTAVQEVLDEFLTRREGDRVGLVVFGNAPFVQVPFTQDLDACRMLLEETAVRMAGPRTAFGDAIGLGITLFEESEVEDRVMIALTDGNDTGSRVPPAEAAKIAADNEIQIHVVGIGDPSSVGEQELDEEALQAVADATGGRYFFAQDRDQLEEIYAELDRLGTRDVEAETYRPRLDLFHFPLAAFFALLLVMHLALLIRAAWRTRRAAHG